MKDMYTTERTYDCLFRCLERLIGLEDADGNNIVSSYDDEEDKWYIW